MTDEDLPESDHIVRYIKPTMVRENGNPDGSSFVLRANRRDESGLSVNWLEVLGSGRSNQLKVVRELARIQLKRNGRLAELNVGEVLQKVSRELDTLRIVHDPLEELAVFDADPSHALISGLPAADTDQAILIGDLIAKCVTSMHPAEE